MTFDTDIAAAEDVLTIEKIKAQDWRDNANRIADLETIKAQDWRDEVKNRLELDKQKQAEWKTLEERRHTEYEDQRRLDNESERKRLSAIEREAQSKRDIADALAVQGINELILALAPNYMKASTATTPDGMAKDAERDGEFLRAAVLKVMAVREDVLAQYVAQTQAGA